MSVGHISVNEYWTSLPRLRYIKVRPAQHKLEDDTQFGRSNHEAPYHPLNILIRWIVTHTNVGNEHSRPLPLKDSAEGLFTNVCALCYDQVKII